MAHSSWFIALQKLIMKSYQSLTCFILFGLEGFQKLSRSFYTFKEICHIQP